MTVRRFAVSRLHLPDGSVRFNQVVEEENGNSLRCYDLVEELPFTEWRDEDFYLSSFPEMPDFPSGGLPK